MKYKRLAVVAAIAIVNSGYASASSYRHADYQYDDYRDAQYISSSTSFSDEARVLRVKPIYDIVTVNKPETQCWNEQVPHYRESSGASYTPAIAGAILGGVIGNQFGGGKGKDAMTAAGMLLGGSIGNDYRKASLGTQSYTTTEKRCETVDNYQEIKELVGYNVKYQYQGETSWTRMPHEPGDYIKVRVAVEPVE